MAKSGSWRKQFAKSEVMQRVRPEHTLEYLNNPHKGTTTFQRFNGDPLYPTIRWDDAHGPETFPPPVNKDLSNDRYMPTRMSYCRWAWSLLEPQKGKFRFDFIDKALDTAQQRGQTLQIRTQPFVGGLSTPDWFWALGAAQDPEVLAGSNRKAPDHNDPLYIKHWSEHIRALGKRFDGHPNLESFDLAYGGGCGETGGNCTLATAEKLADVYLSAFKKTKLVILHGTPGGKYAMAAKNRQLGWRADCFGDVHATGVGVVPDRLCWNHMYDPYPEDLFTQGTVDTWKHSPVTFETCWTVAYWAQQGWDVDWILEQGLKYHMSIFMPKSVWIPQKWMKKFYAWNNRIGYWFFIHQMILPLEAKAGEKRRCKFVIDNKGVAPIYRPYHFALRFSQGGRHYIVKLKQDIRTWMPDLTFFREKFIFPKELKLGEVKVACSIVNDRDEPVVKLAIKPLDEDGWHPLTSMDVVETDSPPIDSVTLPPMD